MSELHQIILFLILAALAGLGVHFREYGAAVFIGMSIFVLLKYL